MASLGYLSRNPRKNLKKISTVPMLKGNPQKKGFCSKTRIVKPKKPNSAQRKIARVRIPQLKLSSRVRYISAYIPGQGHNLREYATVLIQGGRANDLPGVRYSLIRGKYDFHYLERINRQKARSKYGIKKF